MMWTCTAAHSHSDWKLVWMHPATVCRLTGERLIHVALAIVQKEGLVVGYFLYALEEALWSNSVAWVRGHSDGSHFTDWQFRTVPLPDKPPAFLAAKVTGQVRPVTKHPFQQTLEYIHIPPTMYVFSHRRASFSHVVLLWSKDNNEQCRSTGTFFCSVSY